MRSRMRRAAFCRMPAHSISFSSVMVMAGPEVLTQMCIRDRVLGAVFRHLQGDVAYAGGLLGVH